MLFRSRYVQEDVHDFAWTTSPDLVERRERFEQEEWRHGSPRAQAFAAYVATQRWWIDDYALFRAIAETYPTVAWTDWPEPLRQRHPDALDHEWRARETRVRFHQYAQWLTDTQWRDARAAAGRLGVALFGDLPFMVGGHSADVWARQAEFALDVSLGVPPDAFSDTGQDWGMPVYRWPVCETNGYQWQRDRARRTAALFDGYRVDHLVGFYRTYGRPRDGSPARFTPADEPAQTALGAASLVLESGRHPEREIDLAFVGKYVDLQDSYKSLNEALRHAGIHTRCRVNVHYVDSEDVERSGIGMLEKMDAILVPGGFGKRGTEGKIAAIRYARENGVPYLGICLGMQLATIEFARHVAGLEGANSTEVEIGRAHV